MKTSSFCKRVLAATFALIVASSGASRAQTFTELLSFDGSNGSSPAYPQLLAQGRDGNLYGTTPYGGSDTRRYYGNGVVFKITPTGKVNVLHVFGGGADGGRSDSGLVLGTDGNFYGTTTLDGANFSGTIFKVSSKGTFSTLYSFTGFGGPAPPPIQGADGNFYGTFYGNENTAYKITPSGAFTSLGPTPGGSTAPLLLATDGNFYGTTMNGGTQDLGTIFRMTPDGISTIIFDNFSYRNGAVPYAPIMQASDGNFYGTTYRAGVNKDGVAFVMKPTGAFHVLHSFPDPNVPSDGYYPFAGILQASDGNFYGAASDFAIDGVGVIFKITPAGTYSVAYNLNATTADDPQSTPMQHTNGKIYGITLLGGTPELGVVYSLDLGLPPFVRLLPTSGAVGTSIGFLGQGFTGTTAVSFNGIAATFNVESDTYLTATVPTGATTGIVSVTTPGGVLNSNQAFQVKP
jgi:uncharacterized repeat protein (TIGR03803 family)